MSDVSSNQSRSNVGRDQAGRDIRHETHVHEATPVASQLTRLLRRLAEQVAANDQSREFVEELQFYVDDRSKRATVGLKAKLEIVGRAKEYDDAIEKKELFAKLLLKFENFSSAQQLFAYLLAHIHDVFENDIIPQCDTLDHAAIKAIVEEKIIERIFMEIGEGSDAITLTRLHIRGMIYWLADKCFVRWHK